MFFGLYRYSLDGKGRVVIPLEFRKQMATSVVVNKGYEQCVTVYTIDDWDAYVKETSASLNNFSEKDRKLKRLLFGSAFTKDVDYQGRITLDKSLIEYAGITKDVVIVGTLDNIEIWAAEKYSEIDENRSSEAIALGNELAERMRTSNNGK